MNSVTFKLCQPNKHLGHGTFLSSTLVESLPSSFRPWVRTTSSWVLPPVSLALKHIPRASPTGVAAAPPADPADPFVLLDSMEPPQKTAELMWMWKFHEIHHVFFCFSPHFNRIFFCCDWRFEGESSHGLFCCVWLPVFTVMIYCDILHVLIVLAHIRSICQFVYSQRIIPIGTVGWCESSRDGKGCYAGVFFFAEALRVFNQACSILV